jgi:hypothetical protein
MGTPYGIFGPPGGGKTTSLLSLPKEETIWITAFQKLLPDGSKMIPITSGRPDWNTMIVSRLGRTTNGTEISYGIGDRLSMISDPDKFLANEARLKNAVPKFSDELKAKLKSIKYVVIDDVHYLTFVNEQMDPTFLNSNGFGKWGLLSGKIQRELFDLNSTWRDDLNVIHIWHSEQVDTDNGKKKAGIATPGKQLRNEIKPEGLYNVLLYCHRNEEEDEEEGRYEYICKENSWCLARSFSYFPKRMDSDFSKVMELIKTNQK